MNDTSVETMDCGVCVTPGTFAVEARAKPTEAPAGHRLVDIAAVGICGTDYHIFEGKHPFLDYPRVIGHELSGHIVDGPEAGTLVVVNPYISCGTCRACRRGKPNCCTRIAVLGVHRDGGMCPRIVVPEGNLYPAHGLSPEQAAMVEFLAIGAHAVARAGCGTDDRVLVTGAGPIGLGTALFARLAGAEVHLMDLSQSRLDAARNLFGFTESHRPGDDILSGDLSEGFDVVFDATGNAKAIEAGFPLVAHGGSSVLVSVVKDDITFPDAEFHKRESRIIGSRNALREDFDRVMAAIRDGHIPTDAIATATLPLSDLRDRFAELVEDRENIIKVLVTP
ncbi:2-desacetyl-2-hydroxyethyl bacteriochlorophyllide A dehydrogenase [Palleronia marisminoris]|uniref:Putative L-galactonate oxidoreductase n=1 Tax=Palleronia marisminoris TaxID=315423 RepID=A0A1Y5SUI6_9RHOB|nr:zinc-binding alcohol dehydrogenase family protein [Palleronia marisminoris]SFH00191.1 2-desacetyl-2-hydroxyethyl bacteriochlorophyllide A dehydrogenase [Palleronia marisminoris]SLN48833.1 Putative L-galactonate oxidoreductase [Palleronia marisminoris]